MWDADEAAQAWMQFKKDRPEHALALSVLPITGQMSAVAEYYDAMKRGDSVDGVLAAIQFAPLGGIVKAAKFAREARAGMKYAGSLSDAARAVEGTTARAAGARSGLAEMATKARGHAAADGLNAVNATATDAINLAEYQRTAK